MSNTKFTFANLANMIYQSKKRVKLIMNQRRNSLLLEEAKGTTIYINIFLI